MPRVSVRILLGLFMVAGWVAAAKAADEPAFTKTTDVVYGHKSGMALTMNIFI